jgi:hypothetical protein
VNILHILISPLTDLLTYLLTYPVQADLSSLESLLWEHSNASEGTQEVAPILGNFMQLRCQC